MDLWEILKWFSIGALLVIAIMAFSNKQFTIGLIALIIFIVSLYSLFLKPIILGRERIPKIQLIQMLLTELQENYRLSAEHGGHFELYADVEDGEDHRFVFTTQEDGIRYYYPCKINVYTGYIGAGTGTRTTKVNDAEYFLRGNQLTKTKQTHDEEFYSQLLDEQRKIFSEEIEKVNYQGGANGN